MSIAEKICMFVFLLQGVCCRDFSISLPEKIEALSGSCVIINCTFEIKNQFDNDLTETATGVWHKEGTDLNNPVFNSNPSSQNSFIKGNITGKLKDKNCTTVFYELRSDHSGQYFFRIEGNGRLKWTYKEKHVSIQVIESPPKPRVQLYVDGKERQDQEEVLEGSSVSLRCSAETLCSSPPPTLTWSSTPRIPLSESSRLQGLISDLNFTATHQEHGVTFTCTITYQLQDNNKTAQDSITLHVQYSPKNTSVSVLPSSSVLEGGSMSLFCSSDANPAVLNYTWSREREGQLEQLQTGDTLTFNRTDPTHRGWYHCTAQNQHGAQNSSVMLDIQYAPKILNSSCSRTDVTVCLCEADGNPSPELEWHLSGRPVTNSSNTFVSEERLSSTGLRSSISLHQPLTHTSTLQCVSRNNQGTDKQLFYVVFITQKIVGFDMYSLMIGIAVGSVFMAVLWLTTLLYKWLCRTKTGDKAGLIQTDVADLVDRRGEPFYANKSMMSPPEDSTLNHPETLHYSTINFTKTNPESNEIRGISSLTTDYAVVRYCGQNGKGSESNNRQVSSMPHGEDIYQVPRKAAADQNSCRNGRKANTEE